MRDGPDATRRVGRIVEVEAYGGMEDRASHARYGPTDRNRVMFGPPGIAYVYLVYGMYECLNVVAEPGGAAAAVLIRAVEPIEGVDAMRHARLEHLARRGSADLSIAANRLAQLPVARLASGPGLLGAAFSIGRAHTGLDLCDPASPIRLELGGDDDRPDVRATPRIGIDHAGAPWTDVAWRLIDVASPAVSGPRPRR